MPMDFLTSEGSFTQSCPEINAIPDVGKSNVQRMFMVVVFPAPFGPRKPKIVPSSTSKETSFTAVMAPNCFVRFSTLIIVYQKIQRMSKIYQKLSIKLIKFLLTSLNAERYVLVIKCIGSNNYVAINIRFVII